MTDAVDSSGKVDTAVVSMDRPQGVLDAAIIIANTDGTVFLRTTLDALLPHSFGPEQLDAPNDNAER